MKYAIVVGDGMGDYPLETLGGRTPLEAASTPNMDRVAGHRIGRARTIPPGMEPGSDVANLSLLGYDPVRTHPGRAPFEAASMGIDLGPEDVAFRMNLVTLRLDSPEEIVMVSHSSGDISTQEALPLVESLQGALAGPGIRIYPGVAYRHLLVWEKGPLQASTLPPHDYLDRNMASYLEQGPGREIQALVRASWDVLGDHPVNRGRRGKGLKEANSIWLWGQGRRAGLPSFAERYGIAGGIISAVDLLRGIGVSAGLTPIYVAGATGYLDTNYLGKGLGAVEGLRDLDLLFVHIEAPDEASHQGNAREKIQAIEAIDAQVLGPLLQGLERFEDYRVLVATDHYTPISLRTHSREPAPFAWSDKRALSSGGAPKKFCERVAAASGLLYGEGHALLPAFLQEGIRLTEKKV